MNMKRRILPLIFSVFICMPQGVAGTVGHYYPGVLGMRDIITPPKGFYALYYNPVYGSNRLEDRHGKELSHFSRSASETRYLNVQGQQVPVTLSGNLSPRISARR